MYLSINVLPILMLFGVFSICYGISSMAIDIGSDCSKVAVVMPGIPMDIATDSASKRKIPTLIVIKKGVRLFGNAALPSAIREPKTAFAELPSIIGKHIDHPAVINYQQRFPHHNLTFDRTRELLVFNADGVQYSVEELLAMFFQHVKNVAEAFTGASMKTAVLTTPSHYTLADRKALLRSASLANIEILQLMNDNAAVALNYGIFRLKELNKTAQYFLFHDVGALQTVTTVVSYQISASRDQSMPGDNPHLFIHGVGTDSTLGIGYYIDRLRNHFLEKLAAMTQRSVADIMKIPRTMAKLRKEAQRVFIILSANSEIHANIEEILPDFDFKLKVTRTELEAMCPDLKDRIQNTITTALEVSGVLLSDIKDIILFGGGTRMPLIKAAIRESTKRKELSNSVNSDEAAALGAVFQAAHHTPGFRVKPFIVKDYNKYPIAVTFQRMPKEGEPDPPIEDPFITRILFKMGNPYPQKRSISFNRVNKTINFKIHYGEVHPSVKGHLPVNLDIANVSIRNVEESHRLHEEYLPKAVKAHFLMDSSGILHLTEANLILDLINKTTVESNDESTLGKIAHKFQSLFGSSPTESVAQNTTDKNATNTTDFSENSTIPLINGTNLNATDFPNTIKIPPKQQTITEALEFHLHPLDSQEPSDDVISRSRKLMDDLDAADAERRRTETLRNELESNIYEYRNELSTELFIRHASDEERNNIKTLLASLSEWYNEYAYSASRVNFEEKLQDLQNIVSPLIKRINDFTVLPSRLSELAENISYAHKMLYIMNQFRHEFDEKINNGTISNDTSGPQTNETIPSIKIFTDVEVEAFESRTKVLQEWYDNATKKFAAADPMADLPVHMTDVDDAVDRLRDDVRFYSTKLQNWKIAAERARNEAALNAAKLTTPATENTTKSSGLPPMSKANFTTPSINSTDELFNKTATPRSDL